jgi:hypothetical protein
MNEGPERSDDMDERRARAIDQLFERAAASLDPIGWLKEFTLRALRASHLSALPTAKRADARLEIQAISREVNRRLQSVLDEQVGTPRGDA